MADGGSSRSGARRLTLVVIAVIGLGLAVAPLAFGMFDRGPKGAVMMEGFKPFMTDARLNGFQRHIRDIDAGVHEAHGRVVVALEGHGPAAHKRFDARLDAGLYRSAVPLLFRGDVASLDGLRGYAAGLALRDALRSGTSPQAIAREPGEVLPAGKLDGHVGRAARYHPGTSSAARGTLTPISGVNATHAPPAG
jgi:hypothetical protein